MILNYKVKNKNLNPNILKEKLDLLNATFNKTKFNS